MSSAEHQPTFFEKPLPQSLGQLDWEGSLLAPAYHTEAMEEAGLTQAGADPEGGGCTMGCGYLCYVQNQHRLVTHHTLNID